jgi:hypothetical protein
MKRLVILFFMLLLAACGSGTASPSGDAVEAPTAGGPEPTEAPTDEPTPAPTPAPPPMKLVVTGPEETVFDWSEVHCDTWNIPDAPTHAFRDADGMVQLIISHFVNYRMIGPDLNNLEMDCSAPVMVSDLDADPAQFNDAEWINSLYTEDGQTVYAMLHNEYRGHLHPGQCPSGDYLTCLDASITMGISTDGGKTYQNIAAPPDHLVASLPVLYNNEGRPTGVRGATLIKAPDGYIYLYTNISDYGGTPDAPESHRLCVMRTDNISDPASWRYWDGSDFTGRWTNPYIDGADPDATPCDRLDPVDLPDGLDGVVYDETLGKYISVGIAAHPTTTPDRLMWGAYYSFSDDLIDWSRRRLLYEIPIPISVEDPEFDLHYAYPTFLDPDSQSRDFFTADGSFYLYLTRANMGTHADRDLIRVPVELVPEAYDPPAWNFDAEGDLEGWFLESELENASVAGGALTAATTGEDPYMWSPGFELVATAYHTVSITMRVADGGRSPGQVFFLTDTDAAPDEAKTGRFDIQMDGEWHTYDVDMSGNPAWTGLITQIRLDPGEIPDRVIEIDSIVIGP